MQMLRRGRCNRGDFQSGSRVLKRVPWTFSYLYLWHKIWFHAEKLVKSLKFWKSLFSLCDLGSRAQKWPKNSPKNRSLNHDFLKFFDKSSTYWVVPGVKSFASSSCQSFTNQICVCQNRLFWHFRCCCSSRKPFSRPIGQLSYIFLKLCHNFALP